MSPKGVKVSANGRRTIYDPKRKITTQIVGAKNNSSSVKLPLNKKRKRSNDCESECSSFSRKTLLKNYSNFMESGLPQRLLFSQDGQWVDFPNEVIDLVKEDFRSKRTSIEVKCNGLHFVLDVLRMIEIDLKTGFQRPIAWIDDTNKCIFPELYASCHGNHEDLDLGESSVTPEINLHLEIDIDGLNSSKNEECVGESTVKRVKVDQKSQMNKIEEVQSPISGNNCGTVDVETAKSMFIEGLGQNLKVDFLDVKKCSSGFMETRLELFQKQVEITQKLRGKVNLQYGWFNAAVGVPFFGMFYGQNGPKLGKYGYGVHLAALQSAHSSAKICDVDEKGVRYMVLCRVVLGNMEVIPAGSKQFNPSNESFDSGVDDLQNPNHFVIWNANMNTHIFPECVVSFKIHPTFKGDISRVTIHDPHVPLNQDSSSGKNIMNPQVLDKVPSVGSSSSPKSPWMPFTMLFEAVSAKVAPHDMEALRIFYDSFRAKNMNREEFIRKLRSVVGDQILRSTISLLQNKNSASGSEAKEVEQVEIVKS